MDLIDKVRQYAAIKAQITEIQSREKSLKEDLRQAAIDLGIEDDKGSFILEIDDSVSGTKKIVNQRRVSKTFSPEIAEEILTKKELLERCTTMVPVLDEEEILAARYADLLTDEDIDSMFPAKETFAFLFVQD